MGRCTDNLLLFTLYLIKKDKHATHFVNSFYIVIINKQIKLKCIPYHLPFNIYRYVQSKADTRNMMQNTIEEHTFFFNFMSSFCNVV